MKKDNWVAYEIVFGTLVVLVAGISEIKKDNLL